MDSKTLHVSEKSELDRLEAIQEPEAKTPDLPLSPLEIEILGQLEVLKASGQLPPEPDEELPPKKDGGDE